MQVEKLPENHAEMIGLFRNAIQTQIEVQEHASRRIAEYEEAIKQIQEEQMREEANTGNVIDLEVANG